MIPHARYVNQHHPGCFTVVTTLMGQFLYMEDELVRHLLPVDSTDRPDISVGACWARHRKSLGLTSPDHRAPLYLPDQDIEVPLYVYDNSERGVFEAWFHQVYLPEKLPQYFGRKPEFKPYGQLPPASAADHTCLGLTGQNAQLNLTLRRQLSATDGFFKVGDRLPSLDN
jgi:hypothetical protein